MVQASMGHPFAKVPFPAPALGGRRRPGRPACSRLIPFMRESWRGFTVPRPQHQAETSARARLEAAVNPRFLILILPPILFPPSRWREARKRWRHGENT